MANIGYENAIYSNNKTSETRLLVMGRSESSTALDYGKVDVYAIGVVENSDLSGITKRYLNITTEDNWINGNSGKLVANMKSNETAPESTFDFEASLDFNMQRRGRAGVSPNLLEAVMLGQGFYRGDDFIKIIGTNGYLAKNKCDINRIPASAFFYNEVMNLDQGMMIGDVMDFKFNSFLKREVPSFAIETYGVLDSGNVESKLIPCCYTANTSFAQADDTSKLSGTLMRSCDAWDSTDSILYGKKEENVLTDDNKSDFEVTYIVKNATGAVPSDFGVSGDTILVINNTTGAFTIHTSTGSAWTKSILGSFKKYARIGSNNQTSSTIALAVTKRAWCLVTEAGALLNEGFLVNTYDIGTTKDYLYGVYTPDRITQTWVDGTPIGTNC